MVRGIHKLHPIDSLGNAPARSGDIRAERIEFRLNPKVPFPHRHDFYHFLYLESGAGWHEIDFVRYPVKRDQLFLMRPGEVHSWELKQARGIVVEFTEKLGMQDVLESMPTLLPGKELAPFFRLLLEEFSGSKPGYRIALEHLLVALLVRIGRAGGAPGKREPGLVEKFRALVDLHFRKHHSVEFYAVALGTSTKRLTTGVSKSLGKSAGACIQERCLLEAKRLLAYSDLNIAEIAYGIGYDDPNYFARFFKQREGLTPGKFRERAVRRVAH